MAERVVSLRIPSLGARSRLYPMESSWLIAVLLCGLTTCAFALSSASFHHWFIVPIALCGILIGKDAIDWVRGKLDVFDPIGIIGLLGVHFFFLAPLFQVQGEYRMLYVAPPPDWRPWLGGMAILNVLGLLAYRWGRRVVFVRRNRPRTETVWRFDERRFRLVMGTALLIAFVLQLVVFLAYGGLSGYVATFEQRYVDPQRAFTNMGWVFMLSESFPILLMITLAVLARKHAYLRSWFVLASLMVVFVCIQMLFGGLRGSRSNTVWAVFWALGIIHFWIRPIPRRFLYAFAILLVAFMYVYGFYKGVGREALTILSEPGAVAHLEARTGRTPQSVLLGDLSRSYVQAFLLYRLMRTESDYQYAWGRTYLGGAARAIPRFIWPERPVTKVKEGTEVQYGIGSYNPTHSSSRVYSLAGESMLNFGPAGVPFAFLLWGIIVGGIRRWMNRIGTEDSRGVLVPFLVLLCLVILVGDSDNIVFFLGKNGLVPLLVVALSSRRF